LAKFSELITQVIRTILESSTWTSAGGTRIENFLNEFRGASDVDFESEIKKIIDDSSKDKKGVKAKDTQIDDRTKKKIDKNDETLSLFKDGNVGQLQGFTSQQFGNVRGFASDPFGFVVAGFLKKFKTGLGILFIVAIATQVAKFLIDELHGVGRPLDTRFREIADQQIIKFLERKEQAELKAGFRSIITTTQGGLRGESLRGQIGGNFITPGRIPSRNVQQAAESRTPIDLKTDPVVNAVFNTVIELTGPIFSNLVIKPIITYSNRNPHSIDVRRKSYESMSVWQRRASFGGFGRR